LQRACVSAQTDAARALILDFHATPEGNPMNKGKDGNKEVNKPKQAPAPTTPAPELAKVAPLTAGARAVASLRKKKW